MSKKLGISQSLLLLCWGALTGSVLALIVGTDILELEVARDLFSSDIKPGWAAVLGAVLSGTISVILFLGQRNSDLKAERKRVALKHSPVKFIISDIKDSFREITINLENLIEEKNKQEKHYFEKFISMSVGIHGSASKLNQRVKMLQTYDGREYGPDFSDAVKKLLEFSDSVLNYSHNAIDSFEKNSDSYQPREVPKDAIIAIKCAYHLAVRDRIYPEIAQSEVDWAISTATA